MLSSISCLLFLLLAALAAVQAALFPPKTPVVQLTQSNFKKEVLSIEKPTIVMFSAPWCGHCKNLAPHFHKAASTLDGIIKFANIDCDQDVNKGTCAQYQIQGFPTIKLFPATKKRLPREYRGERTAKGLIDFAKDTLPMGARKVVAEELDNYINEEPSRPKVILFSNK
jgi:protein disulfide-isomerase A6